MVHTLLQTYSHTCTCVGNSLLFHKKSLVSSWREMPIIIHVLNFENIPITKWKTMLFNFPYPYQWKTIVRSHLFAARCSCQFPWHIFFFHFLTLSVPLYLVLLQMSSLELFLPTSILVWVFWSMFSTIYPAF